METKLIFAIISITAALVFYTLGVFSERREKLLRGWHVIVFWIGLACDITGTTIMSSLAKDENYAAKSSTAQTLHGITGVLAILLMLFHAVWAAWVLYRNEEEKKKNFHRFSIFVWIIWLIPYLIGMFMGMRG